jgi:hypothetical protein
MMARVSYGESMAPCCRPSQGGWGTLYGRPPHPVRKQLFGEVRPGPVTADAAQVPDDQDTGGAWCGGPRYGNSGSRSSCGFSPSGGIWPLPRMASRAAIT